MMVYPPKIIVTARAINLLIDSLHQHWCDRNNFFAGGNIFIYYSSEQTRNRDFLELDFWIVVNVDLTRSLQGWVVWEENGRYPNIILELLLPSTAQINLEMKKQIDE